MAHLSSTPDDAVLLDVFRAYPETSRPLLDYHEVVMRGPSEFTAGERELIAAYVSGLNACGYCHGVHTVTAEACGIAAGAAPAAVTDLDTAPVDDRMRPVLRYVGKLTRSPSSVTRADADEVLAAGLVRPGPARRDHGVRAVQLHEPDGRGPRDPGGDRTTSRSPASAWRSWATRAWTRLVDLTRRQPLNAKFGSSITACPDRIAWCSWRTRGEGSTPSWSTMLDRSRR